MEFQPSRGSCCIPDSVTAVINKHLSKQSKAEMIQYLVSAFIKGQISAVIDMADILDVLPAQSTVNSGGELLQNYIFERKNIRDIIPFHEDFKQAFQSGSLSDPVLSRQGFIKAVYGAVKQAQASCNSAATSREQASMSIAMRYLDSQYQVVLKTEIENAQIEIKNAGIENKGRIHTAELTKYLTDVDSPEYQRRVNVLQVYCQNNPTKFTKGAFALLQDRSKALKAFN